MYIKDRDHTLERYDFFLSEMGVPSMSQLVEEVLSRKEQAKILDIGCGGAQALESLKESFSDRVQTCGIDTEKPQAKLDWFSKGDAATLPFPSACDLMVSFRSLHEIANSQVIVEKTAAALAPGGRGFLSVRVMEADGTGVAFTGKMLEQDTDFLVSLEKGASINGVHAHSKRVFAPLPNAVPATKFLAGINVFLEKSPT